MKFFENSLRFRNINTRDCYRVHQLVDTFIQETCGVRTPYSFLAQEADNRRDIVVLTRSIQCLGQPGEQERAIELQKGARLSFATKICLNKRVRRADGSTAEQPRQAHEMEAGALPANLRNHGLIAESVQHLASVPSFLQKRGLKRASMPSEIFATHCIVEDPDKAMEAVLNGIGKKRIFGFGMLVLGQGASK